MMFLRLSTKPKIPTRNNTNDNVMHLVLVPDGFRYKYDMGLNITDLLKSYNHPDSTLASTKRIIKRRLRPKCLHSSCNRLNGIARLL